MYGGFYDNFIIKYLTFIVTDRIAFLKLNFGLCLKILSAPAPTRSGWQSATGVRPNNGVPTYISLNRSYVQRQPIMLLFYRAFVVWIDFCRLIFALFKALYSKFRVYNYTRCLKPHI